MARTLTDEERAAHYQAVIDALPEEFKSRASLKSYNGLRVGPVEVEIEQGYFVTDRATIKLSFDYNITNDFDVKDRKWKLRQRDNKFCYDRIAGHIAKALTDYDDLIVKREEGRNIAAVRGEKLAQQFKNDPLLSSLGVNVTTKPTNKTVHGLVDVKFSAQAVGCTLLFDGEKFQGKIQVYDLSAEQVTALMAVINLKQLNLLDLITLADDSILGPSIQKMTEEMGSE